MIKSWLNRRGSWKTVTDYRSALVRSPEEQKSHPLEEMFGDVLVSKGEEDDGTIFTKTLEVVAGTLGVYFAANTSLACREFSRLLIPFYLDHKVKKHRFEVVLVSLDREERHFEQIFANSPGFAVVFGEQSRRAKLTYDLEVTSLPSLVLLDVKTLDVVVWDGVALVMAESEQQAPHRGQARVWRERTGAREGVEAREYMEENIVRESEGIEGSDGVEDSEDVVRHGMEGMWKSPPGEIPSLPDNPQVSSLRNMTSPQKHSTFSTPGDTKSTRSFPVFTAPQSIYHENYDGLRQLLDKQKRNINNVHIFPRSSPEKGKPLTPVYWSSSAVKKFIDLPIPTFRNPQKAHVVKHAASTGTTNNRHDKELRSITNDNNRSITVAKKTSSAFTHVGRSLQSTPIRPTAVVDREQNTTPPEESMHSKQQIGPAKFTQVLHSQKPRLPSLPDVHTADSWTNTMRSNDDNGTSKPLPAETTTEVYFDVPTQKNMFNSPKQKPVASQSKEDNSNLACPVHISGSASRHDGRQLYDGVIQEDFRSPTSEEVTNVMRKSPVAVISLSRRSRDINVERKGHSLQRSRSFYQTSSARSSSAHHQLL